MSIFRRCPVVFVRQRGCALICKQALVLWGSDTYIYIYIVGLFNIYTYLSVLSCNTCPPMRVCPPHRDPAAAHAAGAPARNPLCWPSSNHFVRVCTWSDILQTTLGHHCDTLQHTATHRNTVQHSATHCNSMTRR